MTIICTEYEKEALTKVILANKDECIFEETCPKAPAELGKNALLAGNSDRWCAYCIANRIAWYIEKETV